MMRDASGAAELSPFPSPLRMRNPFYQLHRPIEPSRITPPDRVRPDLTANLTAPTATLSSFQTGDIPGWARRVAANVSGHHAVRERHFFIA